MVVWFAHVRVGHRQLSIPENPPTSYLGGGISLSGFDASLQLRGSISFFLVIKDAISCIKHIGVMDIIHAGVGSEAIYCLYLQGINVMNQKTALFVVTNTPRRTGAN